MLNEKKNKLELFFFEREDTFDDPREPRPRHKPPFNAMHHLDLRGVRSPLGNAAVPHNSVDKWRLGVC